MHMLRGAPLLLLVSCASNGAPPSQASGEGIVAEVHVHQFDDGSHVSAGFAERPVPFRPGLDEQLVQYADEPVAREGTCSAYVLHHCEPACDGAHQYCAGTDACAEYQPLRFLDGGPVVVSGSTVAPNVTLRWDAKGRFYRSDRAPTLPVFAGGETLAVDVGGAFAFHATATAPTGPKIVAPAGGFHLGSGALHVAWEGKAQQIAVRLYASTKSGDDGWIVCVGDDQGALDIPASLLAKLPPPPRDLRLDVERFERTLVPLAQAGQRASVYVAWTQSLSGVD